MSNGNFERVETAAQCVKRNSFLSKGDNGSKCCFFSEKTDPIFLYKKRYGENWKKIVSLSKGYELNISEEELRKKLSDHIKENKDCQYVKKGSNTTVLCTLSMPTIDGIVKYDCGEGEKIFNKSKYHPKSKEEIIDKELIDSFFLSLNEKECLKRGTKLSDDNYQVCWCEKISLSSKDSNEKNCLPYRISNFKERLMIEMLNYQKFHAKYENKCICSNNKSKTIKGRYNTGTGEVKVE